MKWPWRRPIVEHRSSLTDQVVTAILQSASGGGVRPALATAALESCATLYASALAACEITGPPSVTRALHASWRASVAGELVRRGQCVFVIGADPVDGLELRAAAHFDIYGGADPPWTYRVERAGPSSTRWETKESDEVLHLHWLTDHARPWAGISPLQRAADTGSLSAWVEKRLAEEASGPTGAFLPIARYDPAPDADLANADDPLLAIRRDIGAAKGQILAVETAMASADSPASAPRKDFQVARFGANPPRDLVELRRDVSLDVARACGIPAALISPTASGQASREAWRQFIASSVDGLARRLEAQIVEQLGVEVSFNSTPLGGRDLLARAACFRRLVGKEGFVPVADARLAAGI